MESHHKAEGNEFIRRMLKKEINQHEYYILMDNLFIIYASFESLPLLRGLFTKLPALKRSGQINLELKYLEKNNSAITGWNPCILKTTNEYVDYIKSLTEPRDIMAHVYTWYMGDLYGGQMLKALVPGPGNQYDFSSDVKELRADLGSMLTADMASEANFCFSRVYDFYVELQNVCHDMAGIS